MDRQTKSVKRTDTCKGFQVLPRSFGSGTNGSRGSFAIAAEPETMNGYQRVRSDGPDSNDSPDARTQVSASTATDATLRGSPVSFSFGSLIFAIVLCREKEPI